MTQLLNGAQKKNTAIIALAALYIVLYLALAFVTSSHIGPFGSVTAADLTQRYEGSVDFNAL